MKKRKKSLAIGGSICLLVIVLVLTGAKCKKNTDDVQRFLNFMKTWYKVCENKESSIVAAQVAIVHLLEKEKKYDDAVTQLTKIADVCKKTPVLRNMALFSMADMYRKGGNPQKAIEVLQQIITENSQRQE